MKANRPALALALVSALTGCVSSPPDGPLVEYRPGRPPATREVTCEANYALVGKDAAAVRGPFGEHRLRRGERVGFRPEADGSVTAIAPGYTLALPPGAYAWEVVPGSIPPAHERQWHETRESCMTVLRVTGFVLLVVAAAVGVFVVLAVVAGPTFNW